MALQVVTANRLSDGAVVYLTGKGGWSEWLSDGQVAVDSEIELLRIAERAVAANLVVDAYLIEVVEDDGLRPARTREVIRAQGPSVRLDLGKQAIGG